MRLKQNDNDELDYLAQQGFERVRVEDSDLEDLTKKMRLRSGKGGSGSAPFLSLLAGILFGAGLVMWINRSEPTAPAKTVKAVQQNILPETQVILLDTVTPDKENFIKPIRVKRHKPVPVTKKDSAEVIALQALDPSVLKPESIEEKRLRYLVNSQVFYLHDMKITNYTTLYFRNNRFVKWPGLSPAYSNTNEAGTVTGNLKQSATYYLHEEIARAMLLFKQQKYDQCAVVLHEIEEYNKNDLNCDFYLAMCGYYKKNYQAAIELLDRCIDNTNNAFLQEALFYKAVALYESGKKDLAKSIFNRIVEEDQFYSVKARAYLNDKAGF